MPLSPRPHTLPRIALLSWPLQWAAAARCCIHKNARPENTPILNLYTYTPYMVCGTTRAVAPRGQLATHDGRFAAVEPSHIKLNVRTQFHLVHHLMVSSPYRICPHLVRSSQLKVSDDPLTQRNTNALMQGGGADAQTRDQREEFLSQCSLRLLHPNMLPPA